MSRHAPPLTHPAVEYVGEWLALRFPQSVRPEGRLIMNLSGYFDASGTHKGAAALSVAGFLGPADEWGMFTYLWSKAMQEWGLDFFHMAPFESRQREYKDWTNKQRQDRLNYLLDLIAKHTVASSGITIPLSDYNAIFREDEIPPGPNREWLAPGVAAPGAQRPGDVHHEPDYKPGAIRRKSGGPYGLAASVLFRDVADKVKQYPNDVFVNYTFEAGDEGAGQVVRIFQDNYRDDNTRRELRLDSIHLEDKRKFPALQAADILAYELAKHLPKQLGQDARQPRYPIKRLRELPHSWGTLDADELRKWHYVIGRGLHYSTGTWHK